MDSVGNISTNFPSEPILCDYRMLGDISSLVFDARELGCVIINSSERRIDLRWDIAGSDRTWCNLCALGGGVSKTVYEIFVRRRERTLMALNEVSNIELPVKEIVVEGADGYASVRHGDSVYLLPGDPLTIFLREVEQNDHLSNDVLWVLLQDVLPELFDRVNVGTHALDHWNSHLAVYWSEFLEAQEGFSVPSFAEAVSQSSWTCFNPSVWRRVSN